MTLVSAAEAAKLLCLSQSTLAKMRITGRGPRFRKHGRLVVYDHVDLETWSDAGACLSTSEYLATPLPDSR